MIEDALHKAIVTHWVEAAITNADAGLTAQTMQVALGDLFPGGDDAAPSGNDLPRNSYEMQTARTESSGTKSDHEIYPVLFTLWAKGLTEVTGRLGKLRAAFNETNSASITLAGSTEGTLDIVEFQSSEAQKVDSHVHVARLLLNFRVNRQH